MAVEESGEGRRGEAFDAVAASKALLRCSLMGSLGTLDKGSGTPYVSMAAVAPDHDGSPLLLLSTLALHTVNLLHDSRVSLLLDERTFDDGSQDPMTRTRISLTGTIAATDDDLARGRFLRHHPDAAGYADFKDFSFYRMTIDAAHLVAGFGRIVDLTPDRILDDVSDVAELLAFETGAVEHMNEDHLDAIDLYAEVYAGEEGGGFRCVACDPDGLTLRRGMRLVRIPFPKRVTAGGPMRMTLKQLADDARRQ